VGVTAGAAVGTGFAIATNFTSCFAAGAFSAANCASNSNCRATAFSRIATERCATAISHAAFRSAKRFSRTAVRKRTSACNARSRSVRPNNNSVDQFPVGGVLIAARAADETSGTPALD